MSRSDAHEYEYPPGLPMARPLQREYAFSDRDPPIPSFFTSADRRPSVSTSPFTPTFNTRSQPGSARILPAEFEYGFASGTGADRWAPATNRHNLATSPVPTPASFFPHPHLRSPLPSSSVPSSQSPSSSLVVGANSAYTNGVSAIYSPTNDRDFFARHPPTPLPISHSPSLSLASRTSPPPPLRSTLWWGELEPWMDEEYAKQVCGLMGWDSVSVKIPHSAPNPVTGQQANNPGYCFLTFPSPTHAASVLASLNPPTSANGSNQPPVIMPNSTKPFVLNWASTPTPTASSSTFPVSANQPPAVHQYPKEYSIFVGDLAPETSNSDLVAVFRNPVLGLRNDREPKFIRPFASCKSAKIMLDPVTGVSRGYGFVRFTDETDQQRALIEMHGLYCLSRPMRVSPATAKFKAPPVPGDPNAAYPAQFQDGSSFPSFDQQQQQQQQPQQPVTLALPLPTSTSSRSVSSPIAATSTNPGPSSSLNASASTFSLASSASMPSLSGGSSTSTSTSSFSLPSAPSDDTLGLSPEVLSQLAHYANVSLPSSATPTNASSSIPKASNNNTATSSNSTTSITAPFAYPKEGSLTASGELPRYTLGTEESWKHQAQARAILGNLIGPNGEQLTSTDPYNTTVFVGGLSPLISEDTLRTFFAPFGDIHYVKVPLGKHCGFVQFVRKADAERAIERMQGFPIGGSRIRLSWGRSQYKAAQAAAQAAQAAAVAASQVQEQVAPSQMQIQMPNGLTLTPEQALLLLQKMGFTGLAGVNEDDGGALNAAYRNGTVSSGNATTEEDHRHHREGSSPYDNNFPNPFGRTSGAGEQSKPLRSTFSPFSPDPNAYTTDQSSASSREAQVQSQAQALPHPSQSYAPGFGSLTSDALRRMNSGKLSPSNSNVSTSVGQVRTPNGSQQRFGSFLDSTAPPFQLNIGSASASATGSAPRPGSAPGPGGISEAPGMRSVTPKERERERHHDVDQEQEEEGMAGMQDLNGTLASLDLDMSGGSFREPIERPKSARMSPPS